MKGLLLTWIISSIFSLGCEYMIRYCYVLPTSFHIWSTKSKIKKMRFAISAGEIVMSLWSYSDSFETDYTYTY